jgi:hypothetical protein
VVPPCPRRRGPYTAVAPQEQTVLKYDWFNIDAEQRATWEGLCPVNEYRVIAPDNLPGPLPRALTGKFDSVFVATSGSPDGVVYWMLNGNRVEWPSKREPSGAIDQQPFGIAFIGTSPLGSGCLVQHGDWPGRTTPPPSNFWPQVQASGIGHVYPLLEMPTSPSGSIHDLAAGSQQAAFNVLAEQIKYEFL